MRAFLHSAVLLTLVAVSSGCTSDTTDLFGSGGSGGGTSSSKASTSGSTSQSGATTSGTSATSTTSTTTSSGPPTCGDGIQNQPDEQCDGADLAGHTCAEAMFSNPAGVACTPDCKLDFSACKATCGDGVQEPTEECDDANTIDTDTCSAKCVVQGDCTTPIAIALDYGTVDVTGSTAGIANQVQSMTCQESTGGDLVFQVTPLHPGFVTIWTDPAGTDFDAMVYVRPNGCAAPNDIACGDNNDAEPDLVSFPVGDGAQPLTVVLDGYKMQDGNFSLHFDLSTGADCADPVPILVGDDNGFQERVTGSTFNMGPSEVGSCGGNGNDVVYRVTRIAPGLVLASTTPQGTAMQGPFNSVTYARSPSCTDEADERACDAPTNNNNSAITVDADADPIFVFIDAQNTQGPYQLVFDPKP